MATLSTIQPPKSEAALSRQKASISPRLRQAASLWHLTSLDAPTVAVVWALAFAWAAQVRVPFWIPLALALAAWSFYIGDRLLDARTARTPLRARHHFHWRHRRIFAPVAVAAALTSASLFLIFMPLAARGRNSMLAAGALLYFSSVHSPWRVSEIKTRLRLPKELLVGILFTLACVAPAWARSVPAERFALLTPIFLFIALAWLNCHAIELWESFARTSGIGQAALVLAVASLFAALIAASRHQLRIIALLIAAAASAALLALLDRRRESVAPVTLRAAADLVLLTPLLLLVFS